MTTCRTSHEVRGLKSIAGYSSPARMLSHLTRGAWIEITVKELAEKFNCGRTSHEVRGLKSIYSLKLARTRPGSHLTRGAWIEIIRHIVAKCNRSSVAPHTRCVD